MLSKLIYGDLVQILCRLSSLINPNISKNVKLYPCDVKSRNEFFMWDWFANIWWAIFTIKYKYGYLNFRYILLKMKNIKSFDYKL